MSRCLVDFRKRRAGQSPPGIVVLQQGRRTAQSERIAVARGLMYGGRRDLRMPQNRKRAAPEGDPLNMCLKDQACATISRR